MNLFGLDGKRALITGGGIGIGLGIAKGFAQVGADVVLVARSQTELDEAAAAIRAAGHDVATSSFDLLETDAIAGWYEQLVRDSGPFDILVNDAGMVEHGPAEQMPLADFERVLRLNLVACFALAQAFARERIAANAPGKIINVASVAGLEVSRYPAAPYPASKGALIQLTKDLANEWAPKGIHVNALAPGWVRTPMTKPAVDDPAFNDWLRQRVPLGRWGEPEDMVGPALLLATAAGDFLTGSVLVADAGLTAVM